MLFRYAYRLCPFHNMTQRIIHESGSNSNTNSNTASSSSSSMELHLGSFQGWRWSDVTHSSQHDQHHRPVLTMLYGGGAPCANGRNRKTEIFLRCMRRLPQAQTTANHSSSSTSLSSSASSSSSSSPLLPLDAFFLRHVLEGRRCEYTARLYTPLVCGLDRIDVGPHASSASGDVIHRGPNSNSDVIDLFHSAMHQQLQHNHAPAVTNRQHSHHGSTNNLASRIALQLTLDGMQHCISTLLDVYADRLREEEKAEEQSGARHTPIHPTPIHSLSSKHRRSRSRVDGACKKYLHLHSNRSTRPPSPQP